MDKLVTTPGPRGDKANAEGCLRLLDEGVVHRVEQLESTSAPFPEDELFDHFSEEEDAVLATVEVHATILPAQQKRGRLQSPTSLLLR